MQYPILKIETPNNIYVVDLSAIVFMEYNRRLQKIIIRYHQSDINSFLNFAELSEKESEKKFLDIYTKWKNHREIEVEDFILQGYQE